jgi:hypothetical protein
MAGSAKMNKAGDLLQEFFSHYNLAGGEKYVSLFSAWQRIAGDDIAAHSRIFDLRKDALIVEVDHPGWMQMLQMRRSDILGRISAAYPELGIYAIHGKLVSGGQFSPPAAPSAEVDEDTSSLSESLQEEAVPQEKEALKNIQDAELKEILLRLKKSIKKRR